MHFLATSEQGKKRIRLWNAVRLFRWHVLRDLRQHRLLAALTVLSVALGVAVFLATQIANRSANAAFAATVDLVAGKADLEITGTNRGVPETLLPQIAALRGVSAATPLVRGFVTLPKFPGEYLDVLGIDLFTNAPFRTFEVADANAGTIDFERWLRGPNTIAISQEFAAAHKLRVGDSLPAQVNGVARELRIVFFLKPERGAEIDPHFAAMDIGWAQELLGRRGELTSIQVQLARGAQRDAVTREVRAILPPDLRVAPPAQRNQQIENLLGGFQLNLTAMSLVSLLVGMFLIYNAVSASVVRRRREIGILRSLGMARVEIAALFLGQAAALSFIGSALGVLGGFLLARGLVQVVARTISSLYVMLNVTRLHLSAVALVNALLIGVASTIAAAWLPSRAAASIAPLAAIPGAIAREEKRPSTTTWLLAGAAGLAAAAILSLITVTSGPRWLGFASAFFVVAGFSLLAPVAAERFSNVGIRISRQFARRIEPELAATNLDRALLRNSVTIAALSAAVAMTIGVTVMVFSFRQTVGAWIEQTLVADLFIAPASNEVVGPSSFMPAETIHFLEKHALVTSVDTFRELAVPLRGEEIALLVIRGAPRKTFQFVRGDAATIMRRFRDEQCVIISESFARHHHLHDGNALELPTPRGNVRFPIAGTFYDYTRDAGVVYMSAKNFMQFWNDDRVNSLAVYLRDPMRSSELAADCRKRFSNAGEFAIYSNRALRRRVFEIFDETFAVTYVLRTIAVIVALVGIFLSLSTLIVERTREFAVLRSIGASATQLRRLLLWEATFIGVLAATIGLLCGVCLSFVLTGVINRAFFGWTIRLAFPWSTLLITPLWIVAAAIVAAVIPAWRAGKLRLSEALRVE